MHVLIDSSWLLVKINIQETTANRIYTLKAIRGHILLSHIPKIKL